MSDSNPYESPREDVALGVKPTSNDRRTIRDTVVLPFTEGMLIGGFVTGWIICIHLGKGMELVGLATSGFLAFAVWCAGLLVSIAVASVLALTALVLLGLFAERLGFRLTPRFPSGAMVSIGIVVVSACAVASCLTLDSWLSKEMGSPKGSEPLFPFFLFAVSIVIPFLTVSWTSPAPVQRGDLPQSLPQQ